MPLHLRELPKGQRFVLMRTGDKFVYLDHRKAREAPPFRTGSDRAARVACHVVAFRILSPIM